MPIVLKGHDAGHRVSGVTVVGLKLNGEPADGSAMLDTNEFADDIEFM